MTKVTRHPALIVEKTSRQREEIKKELIKEMLSTDAFKQELLETRIVIFLRPYECKEYLKVTGYTDEAMEMIASIECDDFLTKDWTRYDQRTESGTLTHRIRPLDVDLEFVLDF